MTRTNRSEAFRIHHQGFVYFPYMPPSEQYPVLAVTRKFGRKPRIEPEDVDLTQREMTGFASVYPRLHQVPKTMHERLARWYLANRKLADSWPLDGFWNAAEDDAHDEVVVREPGVPPEVKKMAGIEDKPKPAPAPKEKKQKLPKPQREKPTQSRPSTSNTSKATPFPPSVVVRCQELEQWSQQEYFTAELKAAERSFSYIRGWVEDAQNGGRSPSKVQLDELLSFASSALTRASEAVKISSAVMDDLGSAPAPLVHPAFMAWQQQQQHQEEQQQQTMGTSVENRKRPFEVTGDEGIQAGPSGVGKIRKLSPYRSTAEARSRDPPIHPGFLQQFASQQPGPVPTSHTHNSFMVAPMHGSASGYLPMGDDNDGQHQESASESGGESGDEEEDEEDDDEEQEDDDGGDGEDEGDNSDDDASG